MIPPPFAVLRRGSRSSSRHRQLHRKHRTKGKKSQCGNGFLDLDPLKREYKKESERWVYMCVGWGGQAKTVQNPHFPTPSLIPLPLLSLFLSFNLFLFISNIFHCFLPRPLHPDKRGVFIQCNINPTSPFLFPFFSSLLLSNFPSPKQHTHFTHARAAGSPTHPPPKRGEKKTLSNSNHSNVTPVFIEWKWVNGGSEETVAERCINMNKKGKKILQEIDRKEEREGRERRDTKSRESRQREGKRGLGLGWGGGGGSCQCNWTLRVWQQLSWAC